MPYSLTPSRENGGGDGNGRRVRVWKGNGGKRKSNGRSGEVTEF